jgi:hypothetical protein
MSTNLFDPAPPAFRWSAADLAAADAVLAQAADPAAPVVVLTDEELVALDGLQHEQVVPTPWLDAQPFDRHSLGGIALRGLVARGQVLLATDPGDPSGFGFTSVEPITGTLMLRRTSATLLRCERTTAAGDAWLFAYVHDGAGVLLEAVEVNGLHEFFAATLPAAANAIEAFANPLGAAGAPGAAVTRPAADFENLTAGVPGFAATTAVTSVLAVTVADPEPQGCVIYAGPDVVGELSPVPNDPENRLTASPKTRADLLRSIEALLAWRGDTGQ